MVNETTSTTVRRDSEFYDNSGRPVIVKTTSGGDPVGTTILVLLMMVMFGITYMRLTAIEKTGEENKNLINSLLLVPSTNPPASSQFNDPFMSLPVPPTEPLTPEKSSATPSDSPTTLMIPSMDIKKSDMDKGTTSTTPNSAPSVGATAWPLPPLPASDQKTTTPKVQLPNKGLPGAALEMPAVQAPQTKSASSRPVGAP